MNLATLLISLFFSCSLFAETVFDQTLDFYQKSTHKELMIKGEVKKIRHNIRARDNFYTFEVHDLTSDYFIRVKLFTIKSLKRVNYFNCSEGNHIKIKAPIIFEKKRNQIGIISSKKRLKKVECSENPLENVETKKN